MIPCDMEEDCFVKKIVSLLSDILKYVKVFPEEAKGINEKDVHVVFSGFLHSQANILNTLNCVLFRGCMSHLQTASWQGEKSEYLISGFY